MSTDSTHPTDINLKAIASIDADPSSDKTLLTAALSRLVKGKKDPIAYDGFEPSGNPHIAQGFMRAANVNKFTRAGFRFVFWVADWFAFLNGKGDLAKIRKQGERMIEIWRLCGMNMDRVTFIWASDEINRRASEYWLLVMDISMHSSINRVARCTQIMGRESIKKGSTSSASSFNFSNTVVINSAIGNGAVNTGQIIGSCQVPDKEEEPSPPASTLMYPMMQAADIFFLGVDVCSLGLDQRKVNMLAIDYAIQKKMRFKPIVISHRMLLGLDGTKMSKSSPENAIFMTDSDADVKRKIRRAFCEPRNVEKNPCLEIVELIILPSAGRFMRFDGFESLRDALKEDKLNLKQFKEEVASELNRMLEPIRAV